MNEKTALRKRVLLLERRMKLIAEALGGADPETTNLALMVASHVRVADFQDGLVDRIDDLRRDLERELAEAEDENTVEDLKRFAGWHENVEHVEPRIVEAEAIKASRGLKSTRGQNGVAVVPTVWRAGPRTPSHPGRIVGEKLELSAGGESLREMGPPKDKP